MPLNAVIPVPGRDFKTAQVDEAVPGRLYWLRFLDGTFKHFVLCRRDAAGRPRITPLPSDVALDDVKLLCEVPPIKHLRLPGGDIIPKPTPEQVMYYYDDPRDIDVVLE
jgi:hypothetical protein